MEKKYDFGTLLSIFWFWYIATLTAQKMKFFVKDSSSKCDQIRSFLRIWSHLLEISLMENFIFCAVPHNLPVKQRNLFSGYIWSPKLFLSRYCIFISTQYQAIWSIILWFSFLRFFDNLSCFLCLFNKFNPQYYSLSLNLGFFQGFIYKMV